MKATIVVLSLLVSVSLGFSLLPWEEGQWASYYTEEDASEMYFSLVKTADAPDWLWFQLSMSLPDLGPVVVQLAFDEVGAAAIFSQLEDYLSDPAGQSEQFSDLAMMLERFAGFCPEVRLMMNDPMLTNDQRLVLSIKGSMIADFAGIAEVLENSPSDLQLPTYIVEDGKGIVSEAGWFSCRRIITEKTTAYYSEDIPIFGLVSAKFDSLETEDTNNSILVDYGLSGAEDALAGYGPPVDIMTYMGEAVGMPVYTEEDQQDNKGQ